jgi:hypothetical protein
MKKIRCFLAGLACLVTLEVSAHWQWIDKDGRKVYSDRPPPSEIPEKDILQRPPVTSTAVVLQSSASAPLRPSGIDKDLAEQKKKAEEAELGKRKAEEENIAKTKAENCERAKRAKASFDSGRVIARPNEKGEPEILDAKTRAAEVNRLQAIINSDCS